MKFILLLASYLIGSISWAIILGKIFYKKDIRNFGSGNAGATNVLRTFGKKFAIATLILDVLKGFIPSIIGYKLFGDVGLLLAGIGAVCGHNWPIYFNLKGGKGVATSVGVFLATSPLFVFALTVVFFTTVAISKMVSLGSIASALASILMGIYYLFTKRYERAILLIALGVIAIWRHKSNIYRIRMGQESKLGKKWLFVI